MANISKSINEIKKLLHSNSVSEDELLELQKDSRKGVQKEINNYYRRVEEEKKKFEKFQSMLCYEREFHNKGYQIIAGIDEVGRGPLAGPVVAAAVILNEDFFISGLDDSKKLSESKRNALYEIITKEAISIGIGVIPSEKIDEVNIYEATKLAMMDAVANLSVEPDALLLDAMQLSLDIPQLSLIKGDAKSVSIAAASIVAKVTRDRMMIEYAKKHPEYGFEKHMGYGTKQHLAAIDEHGILSFHRKSFEPIKSICRDVK